MWPQVVPGPGELMFERLGLLLVAAALAGCTTPQRPQQAPQVPTTFPPEMEAAAEVVVRAWHQCLARSFPTQVQRGLDADTAAEAALAACATEERRYTDMGISAGIPPARVQASIQVLRLEQKGHMLRAYQQAAAGRPAPGIRPSALARRPAPRGEQLTPLVPGASPAPPPADE
jgi:hypothetical protein